MFADRSALTSLHLEHNELASIDTKIFSTELPMLDYLYVANNQLSQTSDWLGILQKIPNITYLNVSNNLICKWNTRLALVPYMEQLDMSMNCLQHLHLDTFKGLANLQLLRLEGNMLAEIPPSLFRGLQSLTGIYLSRNELISLDEQSFLELDQLMFIDISQNKFSFISLEMSSDWTKLDISNNTLDTCPSLHSQGYEKKVRHLDLSYNMISIISWQCTDNVTYVELNADGNQLQQISQMPCNKITCERVSL